MRTCISGTKEDTAGRSSPRKGSQLPNNYSRRSLPTKKLAIAFLNTWSPETADTTGESSARTDKLSEILQKVLLMIDT